jgi:hypothetical protein
VTGAADENLDRNPQDIQVIVGYCEVSHSLIPVTNELGAAVLSKIEAFECR